MREKELETLWRPFEVELSRDYVGLWELAARVRSERPDLDADGVREVVVALVTRALERSQVEIGNQPRGALGLGAVWGGGHDAQIERLRSEWIALGHDPQPGELAWLQRPVS